MTKTLTPDVWLQWARYYASLGLAVFPIGEKKRPMVRRGVYDAALDEATLTRYAHKPGVTGIGVAIPEGFAVLDIDPRNGGLETLDKLRAAGQSLPWDNAPVQLTGGGGHHIWVQVPPGERLTKLGPGIDVKQRGGYVLAEPSIHWETGATYRWQAPPSSVSPPPAPAWIKRRNAAAQRTQRVAPAEGEPRSDVEIQAAVDAIADVCQQGQRYRVLHRMGGVLNRLGWSEFDVESFAREAIARFGGDDVEHGVKGCLAGMAYPSGYFELLELAPDETARQELAAKLDSLPNPRGVALSQARADAARALAPIFGEPPRALTEPVQAGDVGALGRVVDISQPIVSPPHIIEGLPFFRGAVCGVVACPGNGKTPLLAAMTVALATGSTFLEMPARRGRCLVLAAEAALSYGEHVQRYTAANGLTLEPDSVTLVDVSPGVLADARYLEALRSVAAGYDYVFIDTYNAAVLGDANETRFADAARCLEIPGVAVIVSLHAKKEAYGHAPTLNAIAGNGALAGAVKAAIGLHRPVDESGELSAEFVMNCVRTPRFSFANVHYRIQDDPLTGGWKLDKRDAAKAAEAGKPLSKTEETRRVRNEIVAHLRNVSLDYELTAAEASTVATTDIETALSALASLARAGVVDERRVRAGACLYRLRSR